MIHYDFCPPWCNEANSRLAEMPSADGFTSMPAQFARRLLDRSCPWTESEAAWARILSVVRPSPCHLLFIPDQRYWTDLVDPKMVFLTKTTPGYVMTASLNDPRRREFPEEKGWRPDAMHIRGEALVLRWGGERHDMSRARLLAVLDRTLEGGPPRKPPHDFVYDKDTGNWYLTSGGTTGDALFDFGGGTIAEAWTDGTYANTHDEIGLLPDGPEDLRSDLALCRAAARDGLGTVVEIP